MSRNVPFFLKSSIVALIFWAVMSLIAPSLWAQEGQVREGVFLSPLAELNYYGSRKPSMGYGAAIGYGDRGAIGLRYIYALPIDADDISVVEFSVFYRFSFFEKDPTQGPFIQFNGGPAVVLESAQVSYPGADEMFSFGAAFGWRFLLNKYFYVEPYIRGGYPFIGGGGLCTGIRY